MPLRGIRCFIDAYTIDTIIGTHVPRVYIVSTPTVAVRRTYIIAFLSRNSLAVQRIYLINPRRPRDHCGAIAIINDNCGTPRRKSLIAFAATAAAAGISIFILLLYLFLYHTHTCTCGGRNKSGRILYVYPRIVWTRDRLKTFFRLAITSTARTGRALCPQTAAGGGNV